ncbi:MAG TPA: tripartite tricarboxylate transporter TctB family protein [Candidatus Methylomirabilis sp.]|nr:tripartite tricarboxylate transporter TctB family protein [Candidatus Methylomirabilis sp.]HSC71284.1 tripartite tricarboxylate transporter TctB family protein [Candidatus Methylomirabilis sp.]
MARADFLTGIALILLSVYVVFESWRMPRLEHLKVHPLSVPGIVPAFLGSVVFLFAVILVVRSVLTGGHRLGLSTGVARRALSHPGNQRLVLTAILSIGYAGFLVGSIPYWLATGMFVLAFVAIFEWRPGMRRREYFRLGLVAGVLAVVTSALVTWVFQSLFLVTLP